jgi:hypothetical protein
MTLRRLSSTGFGSSDDMLAFNPEMTLDNIKARQAVDSRDILPDGSTVETRICISKLIIKIKKGKHN